MFRNGEWEGLRELKDFLEHASPYGGPVIPSKKKGHEPQERSSIGHLPRYSYTDSI